jgi:hypothetical protein
MADIDNVEEVEAIEEEDSRKPRDLDSRETSTRNEPWTPAPLLPSPNPEPGFVFRWVRVAMRGDADNRNVSKKMREGWVPCKLEDYPELQVLPDIDNRFEGNIVVGGLMLCKNSKERMDAKRAYHMDQAENQMDAVDGSYMRENDSRMPLLRPERSTRVTFGDGS